MKAKLTPEQKEANKLARKQAKEAEKELIRINAEKNQKPVKSIDITIEWKKSRNWGANPHLTADIHYKDGTYAEIKATASGCGYDKESTVIADVFNACLKYKLWKKGITTPNKGGNGTISERNGVKTPYGIHCYSDNRPHFGGGIGTNCYYDITKFLGGKMQRTANGKSFDAYKVTFK